MRSPCSLEGFERFAPFRVYRRGAPGAGCVSLCLRKPRRRETEREARGLPRTWTAYTRMRCGAARDLAALRRHIDGQWSLDQKALGRAAATGARGSARHGSARSGGTQSVGQHGGGSRRNDLPLRALPPCDSMAYLQMRRGAIPRLSVRPYGESADCGTLEQKALAKPSRHLMAAKTSGLTESREPGPLPAFAICVLFDRVEDAKGHSAGHSKAS